MKGSLRLTVAGICLPAILPLAAHAASSSNVQLYGLIDSGIQYISHGPGGTGRLGAQSGGLNGSRWGMKGSEDLGNGLRAIFTLESGFSTTTGQSLQGNRLFGRQAYVGLSDKNWGTLSLGRHNTLMIDWLSKYNPFANSDMGGKRMDPAFSDRTDNSVKYVGTWGHFSLGAYYSFGWNNNTSYDDHQLGRMQAVGIRYKSGGLDAAVLYHSKNADAPKAGASSANREDRILGGISYDFRFIKLYGGYRWLKQKLASTSYTSNMYWAGVRYSSSAATHWSVAAYKMLGTVCDSLDYASCPAAEGVGKNQKPTMLLAGVDHSLSKRTLVYMYGAYALNSGGSSISVIGGNYGVNVEPGHNQFGLEAGIQHRF